MSIALAAQVEALEKRVTQLELAHLRLQEQLSKAYDVIREHREWITTRKPGPKPKDSNG